MRHGIQRVAVLLFAVYVGLIPGSSLLVAINRVPQWGLGFGGALLLVQGAAMLAWLAWRYGWRGVTAGVAVASIGFLIEYVGESTGVPFGRYHYTDLVQPQLFGVPLAICAAWMMSAASAHEIARQLVLPIWGRNGVLLLTATLVLLLDLQIETVAALVNRYWVWIDSGPYYGVPTANFVAWWLIGLGMAWILSHLLDRDAPIPATTPKQLRSTTGSLLLWIPALLYLLSTAMFAVINLARGYVLAGCIGVAVLLVAGAISGAFRASLPRRTAHRQYD